MKLLLRDGYIETSDKGNTYCGVVAHEIMNFCIKLAREENLDYNFVLNDAMIKFETEFNRLKELS